MAVVATNFMCNANLEVFQREKSLCRPQSKDAEHSVIVSFSIYKLQLHDYSNIASTKHKKVQSCFLIIQTKGVDHNNTHFMYNLKVFSKNKA